MDARTARLAATVATGTKGSSCRRAGGRCLTVPLVGTGSRGAATLTAVVMVVAVLAPTSLFALSDPDAVQRICLEREPEAVCTCAAEGLADDLGLGVYEAYSAVVDDYLARRAAGAGMGAAWDGAVAADGANLSETNDWGRAHQARIEACTS